MSTRILLTGSNGLLVKKIVNLLAERSHVDLLALGKGTNRTPLRIAYEYRSVDLTDQEAAVAIFVT